MNSILQKFTCLLSFIFCYYVVSAQSDGTLDPTFGTGGLVTADNNGDIDEGNDLLILPDKNIIVAGTTVGNGYDFGIWSFNSNGALNTSFGNGGKLVTDILNGSDDYLTSLALDSSSRIIAAGYSKPGGVLYVSLMRFDALGNLDVTFGTGGIVTLLPVTTNFVFDVAVQPDNKILVAGSVIDGISPEKALILRLNEDGSYDGSFGDNGIWEGSPDPSYDMRALSMALQSDGNILIAGYHDVNDDDEMAVGRILSGGSMDVSFGGGDGWIVKNITVATDDIARSITLQQDGKILIAGESNGQIAMCRLNADGSDDANFAASGTFIDPLQANDDVLYSVIVQPDGHILAAGGGSIDDNVDFLLIRLLPDGTYDSTFGAGGIVYTNFAAFNNDDVHSILLQPDQKIVAAGTTYIGYNTDVAIARYGNGATVADEPNNEIIAGIFPDPSSGDFFISLTKPFMNNSEGTVTDISGKEMMKVKIPAGETVIPVHMDESASGIYFISIHDPGENKNEKLQFSVE